MRVVSLLPAATETVAALGAGGYLVGVSHECDYPPEVRALPRVTRTRIDSTRASGDIDRAVTEAQRAGTSAIDVDVELVARLRPDVIIGQRSEERRVGKECGHGGSMKQKKENTCVEGQRWAHAERGGAQK